MVAENIQQGNFERPPILLSDMFVLVVPAGDGETGDGKIWRITLEYCRTLYTDRVEIDKAPARAAFIRAAAERFDVDPDEIHGWLDQKIREAVERYLAVDAAEALAAGDAPVVENVVTNYEAAEGQKVPLSMATILDRIRDLTGDWPRRADSSLFVHDTEHGVGFLDSPSAMFGFFHRRVGAVRWASRLEGAVSQAELFAELRRTAPRYLTVEQFPHEPPMAGHYYACDEIEPGDGAALRWLIERFCPATAIDQDLILAAFLTPLWGGAPGCRPCFVITSDDGRGAGKSTLAETIGDLYGGVLQFSQMEDIATIKTRLLSPDALTRRVALLDNVKSLKFSWAELEGTITANTIGGRRLYVGEATRPNTLTWFVTLNGAALSTDMAQRSVVIKIRRPERSATWAEETRQFVRERQREIIGDLIGVLRRPQFSLAEFSRWATWERDVLQRLPEPADAQAVIRERQSAVDVDEEEGSLIEDAFGEQLRRLGYDTDTERVFLPSQVAARWYGWATNQNGVSTTAASRAMKQFATEGRFQRLSVNTHNGWGRGFLWRGASWTCAPTCLDVNERIKQLTNQN